ncbi:MAG TPA: DUF4157 domain-containing protein, partial [Kofleriaceae bacterium]|nr:DUF4157 domain-containing protein [Kofleriaceae bacterium]
MTFGRTPHDASWSRSPTDPWSDARPDARPDAWSDARTDARPDAWSDEPYRGAAHDGFGGRPAQVAQAKAESSREGAPAPAASGTGAPLDGRTRGAMESSFGTSFADVRIHEDGGAEQLGAAAYTRGTDIHFARGAYAPGSQEGAALLGHELTHVEQQRAGAVALPQGKDAAINADPALEAEADELGARAAAGESVSVGRSAGALGAGVGVGAGAAPVQAKLLAADFIDHAGVGKSFKSEEWKNIIRALEAYDRLTARDNDEGPEAITALTLVLGRCRLWLRKHEGDTGKALGKNARRVSIVERLAGKVQRELDRLQRRQYPRRRRPAVA